MDGFWEKCEKIVREGQKSEKNSSKKIKRNLPRIGGFECIVALAKKQTKNKKVRRLYRSSA